MRRMTALLVTMLLACGGAKKEPEAPITDSPATSSVASPSKGAETAAPTVSPSATPALPPAPKVPVEVVSGQKRPHAVAVDSSSVYWLTEKELMKGDKGSGSVTTLASGFLDPPSLVLDDSNVYVASPFTSKGGTGGLVRVPKAGGTATQLVKKDDIAVGGPHSLAVDGSNVYWADTHGKIMSVPRTGGVAKQIDAMPLNPLGMRSIAVDAGGVFWANYGDPVKRDGYIKGVPTTGGKPLVFIDLLKGSGWSTAGGAASDIALDADSIYWTDFGTSTTAKKGIKKAAKSGGTITVLADEDQEPTAIAVDGTFVYWTTFGSPGTANGTVKKVAKAGGSVVVLANGQEKPNSVTVDDNAVYWTSGGSIMRLAK